MTIELVYFWKTDQGSSPRFVSFECTDTSIRSDGCHSGPGSANEKQ